MNCWEANAKGKSPYAGYLFIDEPEKNAQKAIEYKKQGFSQVKLKVGRNLKQDMENP